MKGYNELIILSTCVLMFLKLFMDQLFFSNSKAEDIMKRISETFETHPYNLLADVYEPYSDDLHVPLFWEIPNSSGPTLKDAFQCMGKIHTSHINRPGICTDFDRYLKVCQMPFGSHGFNKRVVNVDVSTTKGIRRSMRLGLTMKGHVQGLKRDSFIVATGRYFEALPIFTTERRAKMFMLFRHPVKRIISKYHDLKLQGKEVADMSLHAFANSKYCDNNFVTRRLVHKLTGKLTDNDLLLAKEILNRRVLILLADDMVGATERLQHYFGWTGDQMENNQRLCLKHVVEGNPTDANAQKETVQPGGLEWDAIRENNMMDMELMVFAQHLYTQQGGMMN